MSDFQYFKTSKGCHFYQSPRIYFVTKDYCRETLRLENSLLIQGCYVFGGGKSLPDPSQLADYLNSINGETAFLWIENPQEVPGIWHTKRIMAKTTDLGRTLYPTQGIYYMNFGLVFPYPCSVRLNETGDGLLFDGGGSDAALIAGRSAKPYPLVHARLGFGEEDAGILTGELLVDRAHTAHFLEEIDACIRYQTIRSVTKTHRNNLCTASLYPVIQKEGEVRIRVSLDAASPLDTSRTWLKLPLGLCLADLGTTIYGKKWTVRTEENAYLVLQKALLGHEGAVYNYEGNPKERRSSARQFYYWSLSGEFPLQEDMEEEEKTVLCGLNGMEYISLQQGRPASLCFQPGQPCFLHGTSLTGETTTAWVSIKGEGIYICEKRTMELYTGSDNEALMPYPFPVAFLDGQTAFPYFHYGLGRITQDNIPDIERLEQAIVSERYETVTGYSNVRRGQDGVNAVTANGLFVRSTDRPGQFSWLGVGTNQAGALPDLRFTGLSDRFCRQLLKSGQLLAICGEEAFLKELSIPYAVTQQNAACIAEKDPYLQIKGLSGNSYETLTLFQTALRSLNPKYVENKAYLALILTETAVSRLAAEGWQFTFSPHRFREKGDGTDTVLLLKYQTGISLYDMVEKDMFSGFGDTTWIKRCLEMAVKRMYGEDGVRKDGYEAFYQAVYGEGFSGLLALNIPVETDVMEPELNMILDAMPQEELYAHHVLIEQAAVDWDGRLTMLPSRICAVVDYEKPPEGVIEITPIRYGFETTGLKLCIRQSVIHSFTSVSEITVNEMFHVTAGKEDTSSGNDMILDGTYQRSGDSVQYIYNLRENTFYQLTGSCMTRVRITAARLSGRQGGRKLYFDGELYFTEFVDCDLLSFGTEKGGLIFENLVLYLQDNGGWLGYEEIQYRPQAGGKREDSFASRFAADFEQMCCLDSADMESCGFHNISCTGIRQAKLKGPIYRMLFTVDLGSLGDLMGKDSLKLQLALAWDMQEEMGIYTGIRFSDRDVPGFLFPVQSLLKLSFRSMRLVTGRDEQRMTYQLQLKDFGLSFATWQFPPGKNSIFIFADTGNPRKLGWYAAYADTEELDAADP